MNKSPKSDRTQPEPADEKTPRRIDEAQRGGISSEESARRYETGENPGGTPRGGGVDRRGPGTNGQGSSGGGEDGGF